MTRLDEPGWVQIGLMCASGRRSLWWRVTEDPDTKDGPPAAMELCAGREGDDAYARFDRPQRIPEGEFRRYWDLWEVLSTAEFAGEEARYGWVHWLVLKNDEPLSACGEIQMRSAPTSDLEQVTCPTCRRKAP